MIWRTLASFALGMVAGAVGMVIYAKHWMHKHATVVKIPLNKENDNEQNTPQDPL